jgi:exodeoxyribonuclease-3
VIRQSAPDLVVLQEATSPAAVAAIAGAAGFRHFGSRPRHSLAYLSREPVAVHTWHKPRASRHAFLELAPAGDPFRVFGVHLSAVHSAWTEERRLLELRRLLGSIQHAGRALHLLAGDFNTLAPGERLDTRLLPLRLRALVWLSGGRIRWRAIRRVLEAGYVDAFRAAHPHTPGPTFPTWAPHLRLDYTFVPAPFADRIRRCEVVAIAEAREASDHFPVLTEISE